MGNILIVVDMQKGFLQRESTKGIEDKVQELLKKELFDVVIATKFCNYDHSVFENVMGWSKFKTEEEQAVHEKVAPFVDVEIEKPIYTCVDTNFLQRLAQLNKGELPEKVYVVGVDTECCVLKIATDLFENNIRPVVLSEYCASNGGEESHKAGLLAMERLIGKEQIKGKEVNTLDD